MNKRIDVDHAPALAAITAILAVLAAIGSLVSNKTSSQALAAKNQAILIRTDASDAYNSYESHEIREHIYEAQSVSEPTRVGNARAQLERVAAGEKSLATPFLETAHDLERKSEEASLHSEKLARIHDSYDTAITFVEIAIAIISISSLTSSRYLVALAALSATAGLTIFGFTILQSR